MAKAIDGPRAVAVGDHVDIWLSGNEHVERLRQLGRKWAKHVDPRHILEQIVGGQVNAFIYGNCLVVFDIGGTWTSPDAKFFEELLTLRLDRRKKSASYRQVVWCMESLARANGCVGVLLGTVGAYDDRLGRVIERLGYEKAGGSYYKQV